MRRAEERDDHSGHAPNKGRSHNDAGDGNASSAETVADEDNREAIQKERASLSDQLSSPDAQTRHRALETIGQRWLESSFDGSSLVNFERLAQDKDGRVRAETAVLIALLPEDGIAPEARAAAGDLGERLKVLHDLLDDGAPGVRREAAAAAGDLGDRTATPILENLLGDDDRTVRFEAAFALATIGEKNDEARKILEEALDRKQQRLDACEGLRRLSSRAALPALSKLANKLLLSWPDRLTALATMYSLGDEAAGDKILLRLQARSREERTYALSLIGSHAISRGLPALAAVARDPTDRLQEVAIRSLGTYAVDRAQVLASIPDAGPLISTNASLSTSASPPPNPSNPFQTHTPEHARRLECAKQALQAVSDAARDPKTSQEAKLEAQEAERRLSAFLAIEAQRT